jgi:transcriptional regulator with PAS, ATPase and Fis domain
MVMQNRKELEDLRALLEDSSRKNVIARNNEKAPAIESAPTRDEEEIVPDEEASLRIDDGEKERIRRALELSGGNRKVAAEKVGLSERTLYRKIKEYGL